jgi:hypothetical protein
VEGDRKRHRYFVLAPTYLGVFPSEEAAGITPEGFLLGLTDADEDVPDGEPLGVRVALDDVEIVEAGGGDGVLLTLKLKEGKTAASLDASLPPTGAIVAECANGEIASGWAGAISGQLETFSTVEAPPRVPKAQQPAPPVPAPIAPPVPAAAAVAPARGSVASAGSGGSSRFSLGALTSGSSAAAGSLLGSMRNLLGSATGSGRPEEPARADDEYVAYDVWGARGLDLAAPATARNGGGGKKHWEDGEGRPAAILHGWLTKRNKSGLAQGRAQKERYFVLTPQALCFFPDDRVAAVTPDGYMGGRAEGSRTGLFGKTGGRLPLEAVCEVRLLGPDGKPLRTAAAAPVSKRRAARDVDSDDEDEGGGGGGRGGAAAPAGAAAGTVLFEVDFGDTTLVCNAHNDRARATWAGALKKWAGIRKKAVDEEMFYDVGGTTRRRQQAAAEGSDSD